MFHRIILFCLFFVSTLYGVVPCYITLGKTVPHEYGADSEHTYYELDTGSGTQIVRVVPNDTTKPSWIEKRYFDTPKFIMETEAYEKLEAALQGPGANTTFKMAKAEAESNQTIHLEDIKGVALDKALNDPNIDTEIKNSLRAVYRMKLKALDRLIRAKYPEALVKETFFDGQPACNYVVGDRRNRTEIYIKSAQIIVTFDKNDPRKFSMTIVDAY